MSDGHEIARLERELQMERAAATEAQAAYRELIAQVRAAVGDPARSLSAALEELSKIRVGWDAERKGRVALRLDLAKALDFDLEDDMPTDAEMVNAVRSFRNGVRIAAHLGAGLTDAEAIDRIVDIAEATSMAQPHSAHPPAAPKAPPVPITITASAVPPDKVQALAEWAASVGITLAPIDVQGFAVPVARADL